MLTWNVWQREAFSLEWEPQLSTDDDRLKQAHSSKCFTETHTQTQLYISTASLTVVDTHWAASGWRHGRRRREAVAATGRTGWWDVTGRWTRRRPWGTLQRHGERRREGERKRETTYYKFIGSVRDVHNTRLNKSRKKSQSKMQHQRCIDVFHSAGF